MTTDGGGSAGEARRRAEGAVAKRFSRQMRAAVSSYGILTDPPIIFTVLAVIVVASIILYQASVLDAAQLPLIYAAAAIPLVVMAIASATQLRARGQVIDWLASLPFPVDNVNGLLNGVAQNLVVRFEGTPPDRNAFNTKLEQVHEDCFALEYDEDEPEVEVRIGVLDSKYNPIGAAHRRYGRVRALVEQALVPLIEEHPIERVSVC